MRPHWYQRGLTRGLAVLALAAVALAMHRFRVRRLARRQEELEQRVAERTAALATINRELEAFSYSASHDLRAPLRHMAGFSQLLIERHASSLDLEGRQLLERVEQGSRRMQALIDDMLSLARVGRTELRRQPVDLGELARTILSELHERAPERRVEEVVATGLMVAGDSDLLRVAMGNLLTNAWKFTSKHPSARIEVGAREIDGVTAYFVRDDGAGFDPTSR